MLRAYSNVAVPHNLKLLGLDSSRIEAIVLSYGHMDHSGALKEMVRDIGADARVIVHPDVFLYRFLNLPTEWKSPFLLFHRKKRCSLGARKC